MTAEYRKMVLNTLERVWEFYPEMRLGQLVYFISHPDSVFYINDRNFVEQAKDLIRKNKEKQGALLAAIEEVRRYEDDTRA